MADLLDIINLIRKALKRGYLLITIACHEEHYLGVQWRPTADTDWTYYRKVSMVDIRNARSASILADKIATHAMQDLEVMQPQLYRRFKEQK